MGRLAVRVSKDVLPTHPDVRAAVQAVRRRIGRKDFTVEMNDDGTWTRPEFTEVFGRWYMEPSGYHPFGREGKLVELIASQTGNNIIWRVVDEPIEGAEY